MQYQNLIKFVYKSEKNQNQVIFFSLAQRSFLYKRVHTVEFHIMRFSLVIIINREIIFIICLWHVK